jgi:hypothetical protein
MIQEEEEEHEVGGDAQVKIDNVFADRNYGGMKEKNTICSLILNVP